MSELGGHDGIRREVAAAADRPGTLESIAPALQLLAAELEKVWPRWTREAYPAWHATHVQAVSLMWRGDMGDCARWELEIRHPVGGQFIGVGESIAEAAYNALRMIATHAPPA